MLIFQHLSFTSFCKSFSVLAKKSISLFIFFLVLVVTGKGEITPKGFNVVLVATGVSNPTAIAFAPDGRLFIAQQTGALRIIKNGKLLSPPFIKLIVSSRGERGLLGVAFDPAFSTNNYIYLYYTDSSGSNNRISRFTANGDVAVAGSEVVLLNLSPLSGAGNHNGGNMVFGKDGKLYVGIGDNANSANSQNLDTYLGKILRINPDGSVPSGNPFTAGSEARRRIWAYGMRNPFSLAVQPLTGKLFVNDVGQDMWEEINDCTSGGHNYGWPLAEGMDSTGAFTNPVYVYGHGEGSGLGCSISGGTFFNPSATNYPSNYIGKYFYLDYCGRWIDMLTLKSNGVTRAPFVSSVRRYPVDMATGPDGNLYFLSRVVGDVYKITYTSSNAPMINEQPVSNSVSKGNPASFSVKATGADTLKYQWRKNGVNIGGATSAAFKIASVLYRDSGKYSVIIRNSAGSDTSSSAALKVTASNKAPSATITTPATGATYAAGNTISFSGSGTDPEDGTLPATAFNWFVVFHHNTHTHPGPGTAKGVKSGSFTIPDRGETSANVFYRLYLVVTDSKGATDTTYTDILPRKTAITIKTNPSNLRITLDGQPFTAPLTVASVEGMKRTIGVITPQANFKFSSWNNGGDTTQTFATPVSDVTYTANFSETIKDTLTPVADAFVRAGADAYNNFGADTLLYSKKSASDSYEREVYLKFDISSFTPDVSSAILRLYGLLNSTENPSVPIEVHNVADTKWQESAITWNNKPNEDTSILAIRTIAGTTRKYYSWDITRHIKNLKKAGVNFVTLKLINADTTFSRSQFNSKEAKDNKPSLAVTYSSIAAGQKNLVVAKEKVDKEINFSIYPNPAINFFSVMVKNVSKTSALKIFDIYGRLIKNITITSNKAQQVYAGDLKNGIYILTVRDGEKLMSKKLIIDK